jgi:moderate conductance mechanosensitive channel
VVPTQASPEAILEYCGEEPSWICRWTLDNTDSEALATASDVLLARPFRIAVILVIAWVLNRLVRRGIRKLTDRMANPDVSTLGPIGKYTPSVLATTGEHNIRSAARAETLKTVLRSIASFTIWTFAGLMVLGELNINLGPLIAGAGVAGVALGFGAQSLVRDFLTGIFMLVEDQYGVGDVIDVGEAVGVVEGMTLRSTKLRSVDGAVWHVPNGEITRVGNMSQQWSRALLDVEVGYGTDLTHAREVIARVAEEIHGEPDWAGVILDPPEIWGVESLGADGIAIRLVLKTKPGEQWRLQREVRARLKDAFDAEGIEIPFPQRTVWIRHEEVAADEPPVEPPSPPSTPPSGTSPSGTTEDPHQAKGDPAEPPPS